MAGKGPSTGRIRTLKLAIALSSSTLPFSNSSSGSGSSAISGRGRSVEYWAAGSVPKRSRGAGRAHDDRNAGQDPPELPEHARSVGVTCRTQDSQTPSHRFSERVLECRRDVAVVQSVAARGRRYTHAIWIRDGSDFDAAPSAAKTGILFSWQ